MNPGREGSVSHQPVNFLNPSGMYPTRPSLNELIRKSQLSKLDQMLYKVFNGPMLENQHVQEWKSIHGHGAY